MPPRPRTRRKRRTRKNPLRRRMTRRKNKKPFSRAIYEKKGLLSPKPCSTMVLRKDFQHHAISSAYRPEKRGSTACRVCSAFQAFNNQVRKEAYHVVSPGFGTTKGEFVGADLQPHRTAREHLAKRGL